MLRNNFELTKNGKFCHYVRKSKTKCIYKEKCADSTLEREREREREIERERERERGELGEFVLHEINLFFCIDSLA